MSTMQSIVTMQVIPQPGLALKLGLVCAVCAVIGLLVYCGFVKENV